MAEPYWKILGQRHGGCILSMHQKRNHPNVEKNCHTKLQVVVFLRLGRRESNLGQIVFSVTIQVKFGKIA